MIINKYNKRNKPRLPYPYQEVESIECTGTQWLDTLTHATSTLVSKIRIKPKEWTGDVLYGYKFSDDKADYRFFNAAVSKHFYLDIISSRLETTNTTDIDVIYNLEIGNNYVKDLDTGSNILSGTTESSFSRTETLTLGHDGDSDTKSRCVWYSVEQIDKPNNVHKLFIPCYDMRDKTKHTAGMYEVYSRQFYENSGTGFFVVGADIKQKYHNSRLPYPYQEVQDIESTGTQYIDTLYDNKNGFVAEYDYSYCEIERGKSQVHIGSIYKSYSTYYRSYMQYYGELDNNAEQFGFYSKFPIFNTPQIGVKSNYKISTISGNGYCYKNGELLYSSSITFGTSPSINLYLLASNEYNTTASGFCVGKLEKCKLWDNNLSLIRDFVPCYDVTDSTKHTAGVYDLVNNRFHENKGTGYFIVGNDVYDYEAKQIMQILKYNPISKVHNTTYLYYLGDECVDLTGGWTSGNRMGYNSGGHQSWISFFKTKENMNTENYNGIVIHAKRKIPLTPSKDGCGLYFGSTGYDICTGANLYTGGGVSVDYTDYPRIIVFQHSNTYDIVNEPAMIFTRCDTWISSNYCEERKYSDSMLVNGLNGFSSSRNCGIIFYMLSLYKQDNILGLSAYGSDIPTIISNANAMLSDAKAVEYMLLQCTGDFMWTALTNTQFIATLQASPYYSEILSDEDWGKALALL